MDTSRYFPNPETTERRWTSDEIISLSKEFTERCQRHFEISPTRSLGSLYSGWLGPCVYLRLRLAKAVGKTNAKEARQLLLKALEMAEESILAFEETRSRHHHSFRVSLLEGPWVGAKALICALLIELGRFQDADRVAAQLLTTLDQACQTLPASECEILYGRAGALQAILFLRKIFNNSTIGKETALSLSRAIALEGRTVARKYGCIVPLLWEWHGKAYLGAAHGSVGILQTLMYLSDEEFASLGNALKGDVKDWIRQSIDGLDRLSYPSGNLRSSIDSRGADRLVHWCHGSPGHVLLLIKAAEVFGEPEKYMRQAKQIADQVIWPRGLLRKGVGICHGISGNGYIFLSLARTGNDQIWLRRAEHFAHFAVDHFPALEFVPDRPQSLFEGAAGLANLLLDLLHPEDATFPFYEY